MPGRFWWMLLATGFACTLVAAAGSIGYVFGRLSQQQISHGVFYEEESRVLADALQGDESLHQLNIVPYSSGGASLDGYVDSADDLDRVRGKYIHAIGNNRAHGRFNVGVRPND